MADRFQLNSAKLMNVIQSWEDTYVDANRNAENGCSPITVTHQLHLCFHPLLCTFKTKSDISTMQTLSVN